MQGYEKTIVQVHYHISGLMQHAGIISDSLLYFEARTRPITN